MRVWQLFTSFWRKHTKDKQIDLAISTWQKAIALQENLNLLLDLANSLNNLGVLYYEQEKYIEAELFFQRTLALRQELLGEIHPHIASSLNNLAAIFASLRKYDEAEPLFTQALAMRQKLLGNRHLSVASSLNNRLFWV